MRSPTHRRAGFTLIEIMAVVVILSILVALLVPAIGAAVRKAREAAVTSEISNLATALTQFKTRFGDYPPSRIVLSENGFYDVSDTTVLNSSGSDILYGQLAQRSVSYLQRFWPRMQISTSSKLYTTATGWHDFNGNGALDSPYILQGHECLVFFLGGVPSGNGVTGFSKNPTNPFDNNANNRSTPIYEFKSDRLALTPTNLNVLGVASGIPGYLDSLGNPLPPTTSSAGVTLNFLAYFSAYGNNQYDPNDVNFGTEADDNGTFPIMLNFLVGYSETHVGKKNTTDNLANSASPNPYTSTLTNPGPVSYLNPQSFQIISAGVDGQYGVGGLFSAPGPSNISGTPLPVDVTNTTPAPSNANDDSIRRRERDNLSNFTAGRLY